MAAETYTQSRMRPYTVPGSSPETRQSYMSLVYVIREGNSCILKRFCAFARPQYSTGMSSTPLLFKHECQNVAHQFARSSTTSTEGAYHCCSYGEGWLQQCQERPCASQHQFHPSQPALQLSMHPCSASGLLLCHVAHVCMRCHDTVTQSTEAAAMQYERSAQCWQVI